MITPSIRTPASRADLLRIGCGSGFSGDRIDAPISVVRDLANAGGKAALILELLAERTLVAAHARVRGKAGSGYDPTLVPLLRPILAECVSARIPIVTNGGAAAPNAAGLAVRALADELGIGAIRIATIEGDDVSPLYQDHDPDGSHGYTVFANAYLGARPIAEALTRGADIVVTGRVADPALALGPLIATFGWSQTDYDLLAAGCVTGHLLECGAQVCGGYFADPGYKVVPDLHCVGYPIAEVDRDGALVIAKAAGTGGIVDARTVKEQLLYEIHDPSAYLTPDVTLDLTNVRVAELGMDRVEVTGAIGRPPPDTLKVTLCRPGLYIGEGEISYAGADAIARARLACSILRRRVDVTGLTGDLRLDIIGALSVFNDDLGRLPERNIDGTTDARVRLAFRSESRKEAERAAGEVLALYCCDPAGGGGVRWHVTETITASSDFLSSRLVEPKIHFIEGDPRR